MSKALNEKRLIIMANELYHKKTKESFLENIRRGATATVACRAVGIPLHQFKTWMVRGNMLLRQFYERSDVLIEEVDTKIQGYEYIEFFLAVKKAEAYSEIDALNIIQSDSSWQSKSWFLERRFPERWGKKDNIAIKHSLSSEEGEEKNDIERILENNPEVLRILEGIFSGQIRDNKDSTAENKL